MMPHAPSLSYEPERLAIVENYRLSGLVPDATLDAVTRCAARALTTPIALVTVVGGTSQHFLSAVGLGTMTTTPRDIAFCAYAIAEDDILVVEDACADPRFAENPLVTASPYICFYAGAPLRSAEGFRLGTLCAIDRVPRTLSATERMTLRDLADCAERILGEHRRRCEVVENLQAALHRAETAIRAKAEFFANMSHDLRTPLNAIIGFSELIVSGSTQPAARNSEYATHIRQSGQHLSLMIDRLLAQSTEGVYDHGTDSVSPKAWHAPRCT